MKSNIYINISVTDFKLIYVQVTSEMSRLGTTIDVCISCTFYAIVSLWWNIVQQSSRSG